MRIDYSGMTRRRRIVPAIVVGLVLLTGCNRPGGGGNGGGGNAGGGNSDAALSETDAGLPKHTIYRPRDLAAITRPMPVVVWGNGGCMGNGSTFGPMLTPLAATGVLAIANGAPGGSGQTTAQMLLDSVDWAVRENSRQGSKYFGKIDVEAISAQGQSCGGLEAIKVSSDPRIKSTVLWNSGIFANGGLGGVGKDALTKLHGPTAWLNGGTSDIAYQNAVDDYAKVPATVPAVLGSYGNVGHMGLWTNAATARQMATVNRAWLDASLYGDATAKQQFIGADCGLCRGTQWKIQSKNW
jgi:hypothetical protein